MIPQVLPGAAVGVLGSGQLGRMFAIAARRLGYRVHVLSPDRDTPTGQVADVEVEAAYDDLDAVDAFAQAVEVVTFEFENVPSETVDAVERRAPVRPGRELLYTTQHRLREKTYLRSHGIPVTPFHAIRSLDELNQLSDDELPGILKTASWGYDGKGQAKVESRADLAPAWDRLNSDDVIYERFVDFTEELSVVAARGADGTCVSYGPMANTHCNHILDLSVTPAGFSPQIASEAEEIARTIMTDLDVIGVLCVEFFLASDGSLLVNEIAPRPHNSGHLTIDAHVSCQFEQQVRAICGLPLGAATQLGPAAMANLLGDVWEQGEPSWGQALANPAAKLHLYGKQEPRPGRKMGHLTVVADTPESAAAQALTARDALRGISRT